MTRTQPTHSESGDGAAEMLTIYQRLAAMDPPALRSLAVELQRLSDESSGSAAPQTSAEKSKAQHNAERAAAAHAALASVDSEGDGSR